MKNIKEAIEDLKLEIKSNEEELPYSKEVLQRNKILLNYIEQLEKENKRLEEEIMENDLKVIGAEEYTKASMGEIIEKYYTANEDCIPKSVIRDKIEELVNKIDGTNKGFIYACEVDLLEELIGEVSKTKQEYWNKYDD